MRFCADASFVVRLYDPSTDPSQRDVISGYLVDDEKTATLSDICRVEVLIDRNSRQRPLAAAAGLHVWPALDKYEKGLVKHAARLS